MQLVNTSKPSVLQQLDLSEIAASQIIKTTRPRLSMIWITEFDGEHQRLVAQWVVNSVNEE